jgi:glycerol-3-phosphate dehydrogenase subunit B
MQPLNVDGKPIFDNLFAAGGLLAGADRGMEGSRQGIDLATAYRAIEAALL